MDTEDRLQQCKLAQPYLKEWQAKEKDYDYDSQLADYKRRLTQWQAEQKSGNAKGKRLDNQNQMTGQHRPTV